MTVPNNNEKHRMAELRGSLSVLDRHLPWRQYIYRLRFLTFVLHHNVYATIDPKCIIRISAQISDEGILPSSSCGSHV